MVLKTNEPEMDQEVEEINDPVKLIERGNRSLVINDLEDSTECLARACSLLSERYGDGANECAEAYMYYGKALLEASRKETEVVEGAVFDNTLNLVPMKSKIQFNADSDGNDEADDEDANDDGDGDGDDNDNGDIKPNSSEAANNGETVTINVTDDGDKQTTSSSSGAQDGSNGNKSDGVSETKEDEEDVEEETDLELAWEMLELAKQIFEKRPVSNERDDFLAQTYLALSEVSTENENFTTALEDLQTGLALIERLHSAHYVNDRELSRFYYQKGLIHFLKLEKDEAVIAFERTKSLLKSHLEFLKAKSETTGEAINEISNLISELNEKIEDTKTSNIVTRILPRPDVNGASTSSSGLVFDQKVNGTSTSETNKVVNVSHLVKRKRKADDESKEMENGVKQAKLADD